MHINFDLVDYFRSTRISKNWAILSRWLEMLGIQVGLHFCGAPGTNAQIGASCGVVAARVLTWHMQNPASIATFNGATSPGVLKHANTALAARDKVPTAFADTCKTIFLLFLSESAVNFLGRYYMRVEAGLTSDDDQRHLQDVALYVCLLRSAAS